MDRIKDISKAHVRAGAAICMLAALAVAALIAAGVKTYQYDAAANTIRGIYQKAFYETCELAESMAVDLNKLTVAGGGARGALLSDIIRQSQSVQANLALLPIDASVTAPTMKFINQVGDLCASLLRRLSAGGDMTDTDYTAVTSLSESAAELSMGFSDLLSNYAEGTAQLSDNATADQQLSSIIDPAADYPALLYDGPFSDGAGGTRFRYLEGLNEVSAEEAQVYLTRFVGADTAKNVHLEAESDIYTPCYEFSLMSGGRQMYAAVTKTGGKVLYLMCSNAPGQVVMSEAECLEKAGAFLLSRGFGDMEVSFFSVYGGIMTINYAATEGGVIMYPDLIKIQVAMDDGSIVGVEAGNYLRNHVSRDLNTPGITEGEAIAKLGGQLTPEQARLCVVPYGTGERFCYEISAYGNDGRYLIYIDAMTGDEIDIMQVVDSTGGTLVM